MPLNATPGDAGANSYLTVAEADGIAEDLGLGPADKAWLEAADEDKEKALRRATVEIDAYVGVAGVRWATTQALVFPRVPDESAGDPFIIPNVRLATYAQAIHLLRNSEPLDNADSRRAKGLIQFSDDDGSGSVVSVKPEFGALSQRAIVHLRAIRGLGRTSLRSVRIAGSGPSPHYTPRPEY